MSDRILPAILISATLCVPFGRDRTILAAGSRQARFKHYLQIRNALAAVTWIVASLLTPWFDPLSRASQSQR